MIELQAKGRRIFIRHIKEEDNRLIEGIIREVMSEFNADPQTTIIGDPALKTMFQNFQKPRSVYFIVEVDGRIKGGCGIAQLDGESEDVCELQRMFLTTDARGLGVGKKLLELCVSKAHDFNYTQMYLETLSDMNAAISLYRKYEFRQTETPMGNTGHGGCNVFMVRGI